MVIRIEYRTIENNGVVCCYRGESCASWFSVTTRSQFGWAARAYARHVLLSVSVIFFALFAPSSNGAGFQEFTGDDVQFGVWYPTDTPLTLQRLGPFETKMAHDAPPRPGEYPVVLFSHGNGGRYRNHYLTAEAVADANFVVIPPTHQADYLVGGPESAAALDHRYLELSRALEAVRADPMLGPSLSDGPVHGLGYSLGGATILLAAGARFDSDLADRHCAENQQQDAEFCADPGFIFRFLQSFRFSPHLRPTSDPFRHTPFITGRAVLVAPIFQGINVRPGPDLQSLTILAIASDRIAQPRFHARPLQEALAEALPVSFTTVEGHHYAFIAPFPEWLTSQEDIPVAEDPEGFDRPKFIEKINAHILKALTAE